MEVNVAKGKTEIVISYNGLGSGALKHDVQHEYGSMLSLEFEDGTTSVHVVRCYKHVGIFEPSSPTMSDQIVQCCRAVEGTMASAKMWSRTRSSTIR